MPFWILKPTGISYRSRVGVLGLLLILSLAPFLVRAHPRQEPEIQWSKSGDFTVTISHIPHSDVFVIRVQNNSHTNIAVCRWFWLYRLRFFDVSGHLLEDSGEYLAHGEYDPILASDVDWVVLRYHDALSFE